MTNSSTRQIDQEASALGAVDRNDTPRILVYAPNSDSSIANGLGNPEYSYRFVLNHFMPVLERMGEVIQVTDPELEVDPLYRESANRGQSCHFLSFTPPNKAQLGLECPTSTVFAWEFDTLPNELWDDDPRQDWRTVLRDHGRAIVLSTHTRNVVAAAMGMDFPVAAIPAPIYDRVRRRQLTGGVMSPRQLHIEGDVVDSRDMTISPDKITHNDPLRFCTRDWNGERVDFRFDQESPDRGLLVGFYHPEPFGTWSRLAEPWILLPFQVSGRVSATLLVGSYGPNIGQRIGVHLGEEDQSITLTAAPQLHNLSFHVKSPTNLLRFSGLNLNLPDDASDIRAMGISLCEMSIAATPNAVVRGIRRITRRPALFSTAMRPKASKSDSPNKTRQDLPINFSGVVFTSVLNPSDGRKNWEEIVTAFAAALGEREDATLVLKMTHHSLASFFGDLHAQLYRIGPVKCRIVALRGFLDDEDYQSLVFGSSFYVNASGGEGLCMPLMEFMSAGVPAIAPDNTAMADYVDDNSTFVVSSTRQMTSWPHDPRLMLRARYYRIDWTSLTTAFEAAYDVAKNDPERYAQMSAAASSKLEAFGSDRVVIAALDRALKLKEDHA